MAPSRAPMNYHPIMQWFTTPPLTKGCILQRSRSEGEMNWLLARNPNDPNFPFFMTPSQNWPFAAAVTFYPFFGRVSSFVTLQCERKIDNFKFFCCSFCVICLCFPIWLFKVRPETVCFKLSPPRLQNFVMINSIQPNQQFWRGTTIFTQLSWISFHLDNIFFLNPIYAKSWISFVWSGSFYVHVACDKDASAISLNPKPKISFILIIKACGKDNSEN